MTRHERKKTERGPAPADNPEHDPNQECDPTPGKNAKGGTNKPECPEGYSDRQPTKPPEEEPDQRPR